MSIPHSYIYIYDEVAFYSYKSLNEEELLRVVLGNFACFGLLFTYFDDSLSQDRCNTDDCNRKLVYANYCAKLSHLFSFTSFL